MAACKNLPMGLELNGDELRKKSAQLSKFAQERAQHERRVTELAGEFAGTWTGAAGSAVQSALSNYLTQASDVRREELDMSHLLDEAIAAYEGTDGNAAGSLAQSMNI
ncbi:Proteins of 100 residues with WXG [Mycobacterium sp. 88mf]|nr:Proteins of 100 residues with WXG [Mycobacterium sp. 88mf]SFF14284.1 Proteins of 100 residues with WXG [Mycobacterium sp. 455mf]